MVGNFYVRVSPTLGRSPARKDGGQGRPGAQLGQTTYCAADWIEFLGNIFETQSLSLFFFSNAHFWGFMGNE